MRRGERLTFLLVALLLFSIVTTASAVSQSWYLTDDTAGVPAGVYYFMDNGSGAGTSDVSMGTNVYYCWAANAPAAETCDMSGTWKTHIEFSGITGEESVAVVAAVSVLSGGECYWKSKDYKNLTSEDNIYDVDLDTSDYEIELDEYLIFRVQQSIGGSEDEKIVVTSGESYISSPGTDTGYPVPELNSLVLFSVGLLAFAGYVLVRRRK